MRCSGCLERSLWTRGRILSKEASGGEACQLVRLYNDRWTLTYSYWTLSVEARSRHLGLVTKAQRAQTQTPP